MQHSKHQININKQSHIHWVANLSAGTSLPTKRAAWSLGRQDLANGPGSAAFRQFRSRNAYTQVSTPDAKSVSRQFTAVDLPFGSASLFHAETRLSYLLTISIACHGPSPLPPDNETPRAAVLVAYSAQHRISVDETPTHLA